MAFEETGIKLLAEGIDQFEKDLEAAERDIAAIGAAQDEAAQQSAGFGDALSLLGDVAGGILVAGLAAATTAAAALGSVLAIGIAGALENEQTMARLESQLKATGGAAGLTMEDLQGLGTQFQDLAGGTDDAIYAIESVGLRFSSITKDVMPQFIQASLDMAAVMGTDSASAAQMLGMALEDPVGSLGRLRRAGIIFTQAEKDQIKAMQEAGNVAGAQQMILDKLAGTVGGAAAAQAETLAGKWEILKGRMGEAAEGIGMALLPVLTQLFDSVITPAIPIIEALAGVVGQFFTTLMSEGAGSALVSLREGLAGVFGPEVAAQVTQFIAQAVMALQQMGQFIMNDVVPALQVIWAWLAQNLPPAIAALAQFWTTTLQPALAAVWAFIQTNVVPILTMLWNWLSVNLPPAIAAVADFVLNTLIPALTDMWTWISANILPVLDALANVALAAVKLALVALEIVWNTVLKPALEALWTFVTANLGPALEWLKTNILDPLSDSLQDVANFINSVANKVNELTSALGNLELPDWLEPGSPTPFEIGMRGAAKAAADLARAMQPLMAASTFGVSLSAAAPALASSRAPGGSNVSNTQNITVAPVYNTARAPAPGQITDDVLLAMALL